MVAGSTLLNTLCSKEVTQIDPSANTGQEEPDGSWILRTSGFFAGSAREGIPAVCCQPNASSPARDAAFGLCRLAGGVLALLQSRELIRRKVEYVIHFGYAQDTQYAGRRIDQR